ncbi:MAG: GDP-mannose 4,6-dehydratase [Lachnospiraceae bacterium]|nr:GDP-mannose 4,6-dehydratase [Lachnospiraceae bacterium]
MKRVLITGGAGFIGFHTAARLLRDGCEVGIVDNFNDYYAVSLKEDRFRELEKIAKEKKADSLKLWRRDLADDGTAREVMEEWNPDTVIHLAAQPGVRYSIENPAAYISSNIIGFFHILEAVRHHPVQHLVFASSSSVYGGNTKVPFEETDRVDEPESLYAATKKADELMGYTYARLYGIPMTGLRFFTVYGPWGRPDMAAFLFTERILADKPIRVFHHGDLRRDFTYIDDIVEGVVRVADRAPSENEKGVRYRIYNIGNHTPVPLMEMIRTLETVIGKEAQKEFLPMQPGDVYQTYADVSALTRDFGFHPDTPLAEGLRAFVDWYRSYYTHDGD